MVLALGADEVDWSAFGGSLKVYIGHHGDKGAHAADIILPAAAFTEKAGTYVNTEGRVQFAEKAVFAPGDAREDWTILRALADALGVTVGFDSFDAAARRDDRRSSGAGRRGAGRLRRAAEAREGQGEGRDRAIRSRTST